MFVSNRIWSTVNLIKKFKIILVLTLPRQWLTNLFFMELLVGVESKNKFQTKHLIVITKVRVPDKELKM